jgi:hypothetical protein
MPVATPGCRLCARSILVGRRWRTRRPLHHQPPHHVAPLLGLLGVLREQGSGGRILPLRAQMRGEMLHEQ